MPEELIASAPSAVRGDDRLMVLNRQSGAFCHERFNNLADLLPEGALLVFNDSKVRKARLAGNAETGGRVEMLLVEEEAPGLWLCLAEKAKRQRAGKRIAFPQGVSACIEEERPDGLRLVRFNGLSEAYIERFGLMPLPPYMRREAQAADHERYQTVYARVLGSAAAPTAGLHFTRPLMQRLKERGMRQAFVTLHVGLGTFAPVRVQELEEHAMHTESYAVSKEAAAAFNSAKAAGRPIVAVGTTACRVLESVCASGSFEAGAGKTNIFIYPGYQFKAIDALLTNFHTPKSTLLALVSAFAGKEHIKRAYAEAVAQKYKFFSYGDAMLIRS